MTQHKRSIQFLKTIGLDPRKKDALYLHALEIIGAVSCVTKASESINSYTRDIDDTKGRIFWKTIQEISHQQLVDEDETSSANKMLIAFPDQTKRTDGRMWLPLHFALSVPNIDIDDIQFLFANQPKPIFTFTPIELKYSQREISVAPCHLPMMTETPNMALIEILAIFDRNFASILASNGSTPLHFAAEYSNSVELIKWLIELNPQALETHNDQDETPLCCVAKNTPEILKALIHAAPHTVRLVWNGKIPLHRFLKINDSIVDSMITIEHILILLEAFPEAVNISDADDQLPIHTAAANCSVGIFKIITEANLETLLTTIPTIGSVAHCAAYSGRLENSRYIHIMMPELFHTVNEDNQNPLHLATEMFSRYTADKFHAMVSLVPETATNVDINGYNLLHTLAEFANKSLPQYIYEDQLESLIRLLLRLIPGGALATNNQGQTPYDLLNPTSRRLKLARRLLLLAGAPSLHPETRKQMNYQARKGEMNYQARKGALFAFFAPRGQDHSGGTDICLRIRNGAGASELIREVISFL